jgi:hypothetical protein
MDTICNNRKVSETYWFATFQRPQASIAAISKIKLLKVPYPKEMALDEKKRDQRCCQVTESHDMLE